MCQLEPSKKPGFKEADIQPFWKISCLQQRPKLAPSFPEGSLRKALHTLWCNAKACVNKRKLNKTKIYLYNLNSKENLKSYMEACFIKKNMLFILDILPKRAAEILTFIAIDSNLPPSPSLQLKAIRSRFHSLFQGLLVCSFGKTCFPPFLTPPPFFKIHLDHQRM